ncbi:MAG TPA: hypothetical protein VNB29_06440, partial [Chthoniobacterales bacterium]|nr:hypothetical protein [Chthoniobacterales bacterium]
GDLEKSEEILRKKGMAGNSKKAGRAAKEGVVASYIHLQGKVGVLVEKEREIFRAQVVGKPANIVEKIVDGKVDKFYSTVCLLEQAFIKNPDLTVKDYLNSKIAELGENMIIRRFVRYQVGESLGDTPAEVTE